MEAITLQSVTSPKDFRFAVYFDCFAQHRFQSLFVGVAAVASYVLLSLHFLGFLALSNIILLCCAAVGASIPLMIFSCEQQCFNMLILSVHKSLELLNLMIDVFG